jgi:hypothetical protein
MQKLFKNPTNMNLITLGLVIAMFIGQWFFLVQFTRNLGSYIGKTQQASTLLLVEEPRPCPSTPCP